MKCTDLRLRSAGPAEIASSSYLRALVCAVLLADPTSDDFDVLSNLLAARCAVENVEPEALMIECANKLEERALTVGEG